MIATRRAPELNVVSMRDILMKIPDEVVEGLSLEAAIRLQNFVESSERLQRLGFGEPEPKKETEYTPDFVSAPGETLREVIDSLGVSPSNLSQQTQIPVETIAQILEGSAAITPEMATEFERILYLPATFWNNRQSAHDDYLSRKKQGIL